MCLLTIYLLDYCLSAVVVSQNYLTEAENEYVIRGNSAVMKCKIPSFVADFVHVDAWISDDGEEFSTNNRDQHLGKSIKRFLKESNYFILHLFDPLLIPLWPAFIYLFRY